MPNRPNVILSRIDGAIQGVKESIFIDPADNFLKLVGDQDAPGNNKFYGTDNVGEKGWRTNGENGIAFKFDRIAIGGWNMTLTNANKTVSFPGVTRAIVLGVEILTDLGGVGGNLDSVFTSADPGTRAGGWYCSGNAVELSADETVWVGYASTSVNRGYVYIMYTA